MSEFIGEIEQGIRHALKTVKRVTVKPKADGTCGSWYYASLAAGIRMQRCALASSQTVVCQPCDHVTDPDGTIHVIQWEML